MYEGTVRDTFWLSDDGADGAHTLADVFPFVGNRMSLFIRNEDDSVDSTVKVQVSEDTVTWVDHATQAAVHRGRARLSFDTSTLSKAEQKFIRFVLTTRVPAGVECTLHEFAYSPLNKATS